MIYPLSMLNLPIRNMNYPPKWWTNHAKLRFPIQNSDFPHSKRCFPWCKMVIFQLAQGTDTDVIPDEPPSDEMLEKLSKVRLKNAGLKMVGSSGVKCFFSSGKLLFLTVGPWKLAILNYFNQGLVKGKSIFFFAPLTRIPCKHLEVDGHDEP